MIYRGARLLVDDYAEELEPTIQPDPLMWRLADHGQKQGTRDVCPEGVDATGPNTEADHRDFA
jgi:hypothetical protein